MITVGILKEHDVHTSLAIEDAGKLEREDGGWRSGLPVLCGDGLCLREPEPADADSLAGLLSPRTVWPFKNKMPASPAGWVRLIDRLRGDRAAGLGAAYAVVDDRTSELAGLILLRRLELSFRTGECQFLFGEAAWESEVPFTSLGFALDFAFRDIEVHRLEVRALTGHENVVLRGLGLVQEGLLRDAYPLWGGLVSQTIWAMLRAEWLSKQLPAPHRMVACAGPDAPSPRAAEPDDDEPPPAWTKAVPVLAGSRVMLREMQAEDGESLLRVLEPQDIEACIEPAPATANMFGRYIAWARRQRESGLVVSFAITVDGGSEPVGMMQIRSRGSGFTIGEWGIVLARGCQGTGVVDEMMRLAFGFMTRTLGIRRLEARVPHSNLLVVGVLRRHGFVREARLRGSFVTGEECRDDELWVFRAGDRRQATGDRYE
ncbi:MAG: GNAT family N-acetyltransferase [Acidobacteriota bacterium]